MAKKGSEHPPHKHEAETFDINAFKKGIEAQHKTLIDSLSQNPKIRLEDIPNILGKIESNIKSINDIHSKHQSLTDPKRKTALETQVRRLGVTFSRLSKEAEEKARLLSGSPAAAAPKAPPEPTPAETPEAAPAPSEPAVPPIPEVPAPVISPEAAEAERAEAGLIDKNIEARRAAEAGEPPPVAAVEHPEAETGTKTEYDRQRTLLEEGYRRSFPNNDAPKDVKERFASVKQYLVKSYSFGKRAEFLKQIEDFLATLPPAPAGIPIRAAETTPPEEIRVEPPIVTPGGGPEVPPGEAENGDIVPNPEYAADQEHVQEIISSEQQEGTPSEKKSKLKAAVEALLAKTAGAKEVLSKRFENPGAYLTQRTKDLDAALAQKIEGGFHWLGERYNQHNWKTKLGVGLALGIGAGVGSAVSMPLAILCLSGIAAQRTAGLASMYLKYEKNARLDDKWGKEKAMAKAIGYTVAMTGGTMLLVAGVKDATEWLAGKFGHAPLPPAGTPPTPVTSDMETTVLDTTSAPPVEVAAPEVPTVTVSASAGHGYEWMLKRMWEQLSEQHLDPSKYAEGSDVRRLLETDAASIDKVVHQIASEPKTPFFRPDGTSAVVRMGDMLSFNTEGKVMLLTPEGTAHIEAPSGAAVTPAIHAEIPAAVSPVAAPDYPDGIVPPDESPAALEDQDLGEAVSGKQVAEAPAAPAAPEAPAAPPLEKIEITGPEPVKGIDLTQAPAAAEQIVPPEPSLQSLIQEQTKEFINVHTVPIDPLQGHIFQDDNGIVLAYGNEFAARFDAAQEFAKANPGTSVWVQAEKPVFYNGAWRPWVHEIRYGGFFRGIQILNPDGPADLSQIGAIKPETFIKQLDK